MIRDSNFDEVRACLLTNYGQKNPGQTEDVLNEIRARHIPQLANNADCNPENRNWSVFAARADIAHPGRQLVSVELGYPDHSVVVDYQLEVQDGQLTQLLPAE